MVATTDPVYRRVLDDLRVQIREGLLGPGARVPSRNAIIARYGVGETAAKHALAVLATEGLIETRAGSGSYVRCSPAAGHLEHDRPHFPGSPFGLAEWRPPAKLPGQARTPLISWEHKSEQVTGLRQVALRLGIGEQDLITRTRYLLTADGHPVQLATSHEPAAVTAGSPVVFPEEGPFAGRGVVERMRVVGIEVDDVVEDISVRAALTEEAAALGIPAGAIVLAVERAHLAGQRTVELSEILIPADRYTLRYHCAPAPAGGTAAGHGHPSPGRPA